MDADYTSDPGRTLNSRQENYRLTNPDTSDSNSAPGPTLTGFDSGAHAIPNRPVPSQQDGQAQWNSSGIHRTTTEPEPVQQNSRSTEYRPSDFGSNPSTSPFGATTAATNSSGYGTAAPTSNASSYGTATPTTNDSAYGTATPTNDSAYGTATPTHDSAFGTATPTHDASYGTANATNDSSPFGAATPTSSSFGTSDPTTNGSAYNAASTSSSFGGSTPTPGASSYGASTGAHATAEPSPPAARAAGAAPTSVEPQHVMRLLLASHELDTAATKAESGAGSVAELARAAHQTRSAAVDLIAAWYGGADHMRNFAEALLQAAAESA